MKSLDFYRYLRGYLLVSVSNGFVERFINLCNTNKINLWNISFEKNNITVNIYCKDFSALRNIKRKSGVKIKIISKNGLIFDVKKSKKRRGLILGVVFSVIFMLLMNMFVWEIETSGSHELSDEVILSTVKEAGLDYGTFTPLFDSEDAAHNAINLFDGKVLWLAINIKGSKATIEVRDLNKPDEKDIKTEPSNLIANFDGTLIQTETYSGVQNAFPGETVTKGQLLISGIYESEEGNILYQKSNGNFTAIHSKNLYKDYTSNVTFKKITSSKRFKKIIFFHLKLPLFNNAKRNALHNQDYTKKITVNDKTLPIGIIEFLSCDKITEVTQKVSLLYFIDKFTDQEYQNMKNTLIIKSGYKLNKKDDTLNISSNYQCIDYIGEEVEIIRENVSF